MNTPKTISDLWSNLDASEKQDACTCLFQPKAQFSSKDQEQLLNTLAQELKFRPLFLRKRTPEQNGAALLGRIGSRGLSKFREDAIRTWLVDKHRPLLKIFLSASRVPHHEGYVEGDPPPPSADDLSEAILSVEHRYDKRVVGVYLSYQLACGGHFWIHLPEAIQKADADVAQWLGGETSASQEAEPTDEDPTEPETSTAFTTLDNWLIRTAVASAIGEAGALTEDQLEDLIEEVVAQNASRQHTLFHRGYFHALFDKPFVFEFSGANTERRLWYLTGCLFGLLRQHRNEDILDVIEAQQPLVESLIETESNRCGSMLLPHLHPVLWEAKEFGTLRRWLLKHGPRLNPDALARLLVQLHYDSSHLLRRGQSSEASGILEAIDEIVTADRSLPEGFAAMLKPDNDRKRAQALMLEGHFPQAEAILTPLLFEERSAREAGSIMADLALIHAGFRSLSAALPSKGPDSGITVRDALRKVKTRFEDACQRDEMATNAQFCLGLLAVLESDMARGASDSLKSALAGMLKRETAYKEGGILDWTRFLLGISLLELAEPAEFQNAGEQMRHAISSPVFFPLWLWARALQAASLFDDHLLGEQVGNHLLNKRGTEAFQTIWQSGLPLRSASMRERYWKHCETQPMSSTERWDKLSQMLPEALKNGEIEFAEQFLDGLEGLAVDGAPYRSRLIKILRDDRNYSPAWDRSDAESALLSLYELEGRFADSYQLLRNRFFYFRNQGDPYSLAEAEQVLGRMGQSNPDLAELKELRRLLTQSETGVDPSSVCALKGGERVFVLFIGGNETQRAYENELRSNLVQEFPGLTIEFHFPGWTSNWNTHVDKVKPSIHRADAVVLSQMVRTQFGRTIRAVCDEQTPWFACTGKGKQSMKISIEGAARWAANRKANHQAAPR